MLIDAHRDDPEYCCAAQVQDLRPKTKSSTLAPGGKCVTAATQVGSDPDLNRSQPILSERLVAWLLAAYPLWWALGLSVLIFQIVAVPMLLALRRRTAILVPPGFGWLLLFLVWTCMSLLMLNYTAPGTVVESTGQRAFVATFRLTQYLSLATILVYLVNLNRSRLSAHGLGWLLGLFFTYGVVGGIFALFAPAFEFTSLAEALLPGGLRENSWVQSMVHPSLAQVQEIIGEPVGRPAAPFGYTNMWGAILAMLLPWYVATWVVGRRKLHQILAVAFLLLGLVPMIVSLNRGLWLALVVMVAIAAVRAAVRGHGALLASTLFAAILALTVTAITPLGNLVSERLSNPHSNSIRELTTEKALEVSGYSPLLGFGTTRDLQGSHRSIAIGPTLECPKCGGVPLGQNGQFWMVLVSQGWIGVVLFYGLFLTALGRLWRSRSHLVFAGWLSILIGVFMSVYYDMMMIPMAVAVMSLGALWYASQDLEEG